MAVECRAAKGKKWEEMDKQVKGAEAHNAVVNEGCLQGCCHSHDFKDYL